MTLCVDHSVTKNDYLRTTIEKNIFRATFLESNSKNGYNYELSRAAVSSV